MIDLDALITGRQLVKALDEIGIGQWTPDSVRQWIREEPPLPIAAQADQGKPHRYVLRHALEWLLARTQVERAKGYSRKDGQDLGGRIAAFLQDPRAPEKSAEAEIAKTRASSAPVPGAGDAVAPPPLAVSPAKPHGEQTDWISMSETDALLRVIEGRDPRNWKAAEEALVIRRERLEAERRLIPVEELDAALEENVAQTAAAIRAHGPKLKQQLRDIVPPDAFHGCERLVDRATKTLLERLAGETGAAGEGQA